jgi:hypothetical protein
MRCMNRSRIFCCSSESYHISSVMEEEGGEEVLC